MLARFPAVALALLALAACAVTDHPVETPAFEDLAWLPGTWARVDRSAPKAESLHCGFPAG